MKEFLVLISEILVIMSIQQLSEVVFDPTTRPYQTRLINVACFAGSFSIILHYVYNYVLKDLVAAFQFTF